MMCGDWRWRIFASSVLLLSVASTNSLAADRSGQVQTHTARDTLGLLEDHLEDASACLSGFQWEPAAFQVESRLAADEDFDRLVRFPSPVTSGQRENDQVAIEWYSAMTPEGSVKTAPAVVVVHESGSDMTAGRLIARSIRLKGIHAFMVQLPFYGLRRGKGTPQRPDIVTLFRQGVSDIRRARDAVAVLPYVESDRISLQGTSLGGFAAALAASLDGAFENVFLVLAGGNLDELVRTGQRDTARFREGLLKNGATQEQLKELLWQIEPTRIAHRLDKQTTWLYSARADRVVPIRFAEALASAADLEPEHHIRYPGNHYSVLLYFPKMLDHICGQVENQQGLPVMPGETKTFSR
jgi:pimeloyl-ACP methyl ester carboxylesterase